MKVLSVLLVCTFLENMATSEGSAIMKALSERSKLGQHHHRHGHGYNHQRQQLAKATHAGGPKPHDDTQASLKPHEDTQASLKPHVDTQASLKPHMDTQASLKPHEDTQASLKPHLDTQASLKPHEDTQASLKPHLDTQASLKPHEDTQASLKPHDDTQASLKPHMDTQASLKPHMDTQASLKTHDDTQASLKPHDDTQASLKPHEDIQASLKPHDDTQASLKPHEDTQASLKPHEDTQTSLKPHEDIQASPKLRETADPRQELVAELNNELRLGLPINPTLLSSRVSFGRVKPQLPPLEMRVDADSWQDGDETLDDMQLKQEQQNSVQQPETELNTANNTHNGSTSPSTSSRQGPTHAAPSHDDDGSNDESSGDSGEDARLLPVSSRPRRSLTADFVQVPVCESVSEWVERSAAEDMWGNTVRVLQEIDIGGTQVNQYFYETYCREKRASCVGIDTSRYRSVCRNKHMWAYAKVETRTGDIGWNLIRIRGSCNCALYSRFPNGQFDIAQILGKR